LGDAAISNVTAQELTSALAAGSITITESVFDYTDIDCSLGEITGKNISISGGEVYCAMGDVKLSGAFSGTLSISADAGDVTLNVNGDKASFSYDIVTGMGNVKIDGESHSVSAEQFVENPVGTFKIKASMSNVYVNFS